MTDPVILRLGTRGSRLARRQSMLVANQLEKMLPGLSVRQIIIKTSGDKITDRPLYDEGGKGLFVKELEQALLADEIHFAVHSYKDLPVTMPLVDDQNLIVAATPKRHDPRDLLISHKADTIDQLSPGTKVATSSLRRRCQLLSLRPDLEIQPIRGNIDTRLNKLRQGPFDALILAMAGVQRAGLFESSMQPLSLEQMLPAPGQGALALQCRRDDPATVQTLKLLDDPPTGICVAAERAIVRGLDGDCHSPIAALAQIIGDQIELRALVGRRDGTPPTIFASARGLLSRSESVVETVLRELIQKDARALLHGPT